MAYQPNVTIMAKQNKSSMYTEYSNLINELKQYMPEFKATIKDLQEPSPPFVSKFYGDVFNEFFCDVNNLIEVIFILIIYHAKNFYSTYSTIR